MIILHLLFQPLNFRVFFGAFGGQAFQRVGGFIVQIAAMISVRAEIATPRIYRVIDNGIAIPQRRNQLFIFHRHTSTGNRRLFAPFRLWRCRLG